jgi:putative transposase
LVLDVVVHAAEGQDRDGGEEVLMGLVGRFGRLGTIWADGGYAGSFVEEAQRVFGRVVEIVKRSDAHKFVVLPKRWIVERTFAWLGKYRRVRKKTKTCPTAANR